MTPLRRSSAGKGNDMRKTIIHLVWIICFITLSPCSGSDSKLNLTLEEKAWISEHHTVRVRIGNSPPFMLTDGKAQGMAIDYVTHIFTLNGIKIQYVSESDVSWPEALEYIKRHEVVDMVPTAKITDDRKKNMIFTDEYIFAPWVIFTRTDSGFISSMDDLNGKTVSVEEGYVMHRRLQQDYPGIHLKIVSAGLKDYAEIPVKDLSTGLVDAYIGNLLSTTYTIQTKGYTNVKVAAPTPFENHNQAMAIRSDWPELAGIINKTLLSMTSDEHAAIRNRWLSIRYEYGITKADVLKWISGVAGVALLFIGFVLIWNKRLKTEIVSRKKIEEELRNSEEQYRSLIEFSPFPFLVTQKERIIFVNPEGIRLFGVGDKDEIIGSNPDDWIAPGFAEQALQRRREVLEEGKKAEPLEFTLVRKDGRAITALADTVRILYHGAPAVLSAFQDITERKRIEDAFQESEEKFRLAFHSSPDSINLNRVTDGVYLEINEGFTKIMGYSREEAIGKSSLELNIWNDPKDRDRLVSELKKEGVVENLEAVFQGKNGQIKTGLMSARILKIGNEDVILSITRDITDAVRMEAKLQQSQKMEAIGTLAGGIAHDFNNILSPIVGHTELLMDDFPDTGSTRDSLNTIHSGALRARELVQQILSFARQEENELTLMKMQPIIKEAMKLIRSTIPTTIAIRQNLQSDCRPISADPTQIHQIVMNLATNAYHAMAETGGEIKVNLKEIELGEHDLIHPDMRPGLYACLSFSDTGVGMSRDVMSRVFEPFFTTKEKGKGTGMGLSVVHGIVKHMKGDIQVYSEPGKGAEFRVYLPIVGNAFEKQAPNTDEPLPGGSERLLLVDDEAVIIAMEKQVLERLGYQVTSRPGSMEALEAFKANPDKFDLVITDMTMPKMSGDKLAHELMKIRPDIPILLCTGFSETMTDEKIKSLGLRGILMKPMMIKDLARKIRDVLD